MEKILSRSGPVDLTIAVPVHALRGVDAGGPGAHREGVDGHHRGIAEDVAGKEADVAMGDDPLPLAADPVVRPARGAARFIEGRALEREPAIDTAILDREAVDVRVLVRLGQLVEDPQRPGFISVEAALPDQAAIGGHATDGSEGGPFGAQPAQELEQDRWAVGEERLQPREAQAEEAERDVEREQPGRTQDATQRGRADRASLG